MPQKRRKTRKPGKIQRGGGSGPCEERREETEMPDYILYEEWLGLCDEEQVYYDPKKKETFGCEVIPGDSSSRVTLQVIRKHEVEPLFA